MAVSTDGLAFTASNVILGDCYFRVFSWKGFWCAIDRWSVLSRSRDGLSPFESRGQVMPQLRHSAVLIKENRLLVFYSRVGDAPERVVAATVSLTDDWKDWRASEPIEVIQPETGYEGIGYGNKRSRVGAGIKVRELRDPCIFQEAGRTYLFYSVAGEMGIAMAELDLVMK